MKETVWDFLPIGPLVTAVIVTPLLMLLFPKLKDSMGLSDAPNWVQATPIFFAAAFVFGMIDSINDTLSPNMTFDFDNKKINRDVMAKLPDGSFSEVEKRIADGNLNILEKIGAKLVAPYPKIYGRDDKSQDFTAAHVYEKLENTNAVKSIVYYKSEIVAVQYSIYRSGRFGFVSCRIKLEERGEFDAQKCRDAAMRKLAATNDLDSMDRSNG